MGSLLDPVLTLCVTLVKSHDLSVTLSSSEKGGSDCTLLYCNVLSYCSG